MFLRTNLLETKPKNQPFIEKNTEQEHKDT